MQFSFIRDLVKSVWMVDALTAQRYAPVLRGVFNGLHFEREQPDAGSAAYDAKAPAQSNTQNSNRSVYVQPIRGVMMKHNTESGITGTRTMAKQLLAADKNPDIIGHILKIESGGGQADAVPELTDAIKQLTKPVVAFVDGCMCSAAMYVGSYCKKIIASRETDIVGCIGTMIELGGFPKFNKEPDGFTTVRIYADGSEEKNDEWEAAITGDFKLVKERILNPHCEQFKTDIRANRPGVKDEHLKGRTYNAGEVIGVLVDEIGTFDYALQEVVKLSEIQNSKNMSSKSKLKLTTLLTILAVQELVIEDGQTSLNEEQLTAIETALANAAPLQSQLDAANATIAERDRTIASQNEKIAELEKAPGAQSATVVKDTDGAGEGTSSNVYQDVRNALKGGQ